MLQPSARKVDVAFINVDSGAMMAHRVSRGGNIENKREQIFEVAKLILKVSRVDNKELAEEMLKFLSFTTLLSGDYGKYIQNI